MRKERKKTYSFVLSDENAEFLKWLSIINDRSTSKTLDKLITAFRLMYEEEGTYNAEISET